MKIKHGMESKRIYKIWAMMKQRCFNKNHKSYRHYGDRGIGVSESWMKFENFYLDMGDCPAGMSLDRINNEKGYSVENCRWASFETQNNNRSNSCFLEYQGQKKTISEWAHQTGIKVATLWDRIKRFGWTTERALTEKVRPQRPKMALRP